MSRTVIIRGTSAEAWAAALYVRRTLGTLIDDVRVDESDGGDSAPGRAAMIIPPSARPFLETLGLSEEALFLKTDASFLLGAEFATATPFVRAWSTYGAPANNVGFHHFWVRMNAAGLAAPFDQYSLGAELARSGRFIHPATDPKKIESSFSYGYMVDTAAFRDLLREAALEAGVALMSGDAGRDAWLTLDLREDAPVARAAWPDLPERFSLEDQIVEEGARNRSAYRVTPLDDGLNLTLPTRSRTVHRQIAFGPDQPVACGRSEAPWRGRTIAMGPAACRMPDLHGASIRLLQTTLDLLVTLLPADGAPIEPLAEEYNRRASRMMDHAADYEALGLASLTSPGSPSFTSTTLSRKADQFVSRGRLVAYDDELQSDQDWIAAFIACGLVPERVTPLALGAPVDQIHRSYERLRQAIVRAASQLPSQPVYLEHLMQAREGASYVV